MRISVLIPTYEMLDLGHVFLALNFDKLVQQEFKDFEVVVSDNSKNDLVWNVCEEYKDRLNIVYVRNTARQGCSANLNIGMKHCKGEIIKFLLQDDFLLNEYSLRIVDTNFTSDTSWLITACEHSTDGTHMIRPFYPHYNDSIFLGNNTISSPSVLAIRNKDVMDFDENLKWLLDVDYYKRLHDRYGAPKIVDSIAVVNRIGPHQTTNAIITPEIIAQEDVYIRAKYNVQPTV